MSRTIEQMQDAGYEHVGENRDMSRRAFQEDGQHFYNTDAENAQHVIDEAAEAARTADYEANHKYKDDRRSEYEATNLTIGDQLDAIWKQLNIDRLDGKNLVQDTDDVLGKILAIKAKYPKPE